MYNFYTAIIFLVVLFFVEIIKLWMMTEGGREAEEDINDVEDAKIAADIGADAIIVSNHGGRQLDGAAASIDMLPRIVDAVGDKIEVHVDGGIRSGQDIFKAVAMGAKSTYIGRAYIYGLGAMGQTGVTKALDILKGELDKTMALCGETDINNVGRHNMLDLHSGLAPVNAVLGAKSSTMPAKSSAKKRA